MYPSSTTPNATPARRANTSRPRLRHLIHHIEANGTIHTLCGLRKYPSRGATVAPHMDKQPCAACDAARILYEVGL
ncbi:TPA: hypothetical protein ACGI1P_001938 [Corynebacterium striatum]